MSAVLFAVGAIYFAVTVLLIVYGANLTFFSLVVARKSGLGRGSKRHDDLDGDPPMVTVQLPIFNELYVAERLIDAACALTYSRHRLQVQVLDDSTDETSDIVARVVARHRAAGVDVDHVRRAERVGYKAGALAEGLSTAKGEFVAIFDADFVPDPDFLTLTLPHFSDAGLAFVQARWGHLNDQSSVLTSVQAAAIDGHFLVEQACRGEKGYWFNFNGTAGVWRAAAIADAGGWTAETLTEDLDLSYRAHLHGWHGQFLEDVVVPAEIPVQMSGFRRQQHRWARGSFECAIKLVPKIWRTDERSVVKFQATVHLLSYTVHLMLLLLTLLYPLVVLAGREFPRFQSFFGLAYGFALFSLAPIVFFVTAQRRQGNSIVRALPRILAITLIGPGLMLNTARAALDIVRRPHPEFERTAKFGLNDRDTGFAAPVVDDTAGGQAWTRKRYQLGIDRIIYAEFALGAYALAAAWFAFDNDNWAVVTFATIFGFGLLTVASLTVTQSVTLRRDRVARAATRDRESKTLATTDDAAPAST